MRPGRSDRLRAMIVLLALGACASCSSMQSRYVLLGPTYAPRTEATDIEVFETGAPPRPFIRIARLDVHLEKTSLISSNLEGALPELRQQAHLAGADAILDIEERTSRVGETRIYHVTATGIRYEPLSP